MTSDQFNYVIIQASDCYFGFDLMDVVERGCIFALIHTKDTDGIIGWIVSKILPDWVGGYSDWLSYEKQVVDITKVMKTKVAVWLTSVTVTVTHVSRTMTMSKIRKMCIRLQDLSQKRRK